MILDEQVFLEKTTDKTGRVLDIYRTERLIENSKVYSFHLLGFSENVADGVSLPKSYEDRIEHKSIFAEFEGKIVGCIVYTISKKDLKCGIVMSYVSKDERRKGIYELLHKKMEQVVKEEGMLYIISTVNPKNTKMKKAAEKLNKTTMFEITVKKI